MNQGRLISFKFLRCLVIALLVFAVGGGSYLYFFFLAPVGSGPAGPDVPNEDFGHVWTEKKALLLGIGDSITAGYGSSPGFSYFDRLLSNPDGDSQDMSGKSLSSVLPDLNSRNISVSGSISIQHLERQIERLTTNSTDVLGIVVMTTGGNDLIHQYGRVPPKEGAMYGATFEQAEPWIANFEKRLDRMVQAIRDRFPGGCHIFLANIYDPTDGTGSTGSTGLPAWPDALKLLHAYNSIIENCARAHDFVHLVDIRTPFLGHGIHATKFWLPHYRRSDPHYWYYPNIEDPNDRGYDAIRRVFLLEMGKVFSNEQGAG